MSAIAAAAASLSVASVGFASIQALRCSGVIARHWSRNAGAAPASCRASSGTGRAWLRASADPCVPSDDMPWCARPRSSGVICCQRCACWYMRVRSPGLHSSARGSVRRAGRAGGGELLPCRHRSGSRGRGRGASGIGHEQGGGEKGKGWQLGKTGHGTTPKRGRRHPWMPARDRDRGFRRGRHRWRWHPPGCHRPPRLREVAGIDCGRSCSPMTSANNVAHAVAAAQARRWRTKCRGAAPDAASRLRNCACVRADKWEIAAA